MWGNILTHIGMHHTTCECRAQLYLLSRRQRSTSWLMSSAIPTCALCAMHGKHVTVMKKDMVLACCI